MTRKFIPFIIAIVLGLLVSFTVVTVINSKSIPSDVSATSTPILRAQADFTKYPGLVGLVFQAGFNASHKTSQLAGVVGCGVLGKNTFICRFIGRSSGATQCLDVKLIVGTDITVATAKSRPLSTCGLA